MKEKVVVFAGEDKFIKPRNRSYNVEKNYSNLVGDSNPPADYFPKDDLNRTTQSYTTIDVGGGGNVGSGGIGVSTPQLDYQLPTTTIQPAPTTVAPTTVAPTTIAPTTVVPIVPLPFVTPIGLGVAPMGGSGGGGGGEDKKEDKKNYWWLLLLLGLGAGLYIYKKKKK